MRPLRGVSLGGGGRVGGDVPLLAAEDVTGFAAGGAVLDLVVDDFVVVLLELVDAFGCILFGFVGGRRDGAGEGRQGEDPDEKGNKLHDGR